MLHRFKSIERNKITLNRVCIYSDCSHLDHDDYVYIYINNKLSNNTLQATNQILFSKENKNLFLKEPK